MNLATFVSFRVSGDERGFRPLIQRPVYHGGWMILFDPNEIDADEYMAVREDGGRGVFRAESIAACKARIDAELTEDALADASPRNREPLADAEQRRDDHAEQEANDLRLLDHNHAHGEPEHERD